MENSLKGQIVWDFSLKEQPLSTLSTQLHISHSPACAVPTQLCLHGMSQAIATLT